MFVQFAYLPCSFDVSLDIVWPPLVKDKMGWNAPNAEERRWQKKHCPNFNKLYLDPNNAKFPAAPGKTCKATETGKLAAMDRLRLMEYNKSKPKGMSIKELKKRANTLGWSKKKATRQNKSKKRKTDTKRRTSFRTKKSGR